MADNIVSETSLQSLFGAYKSDETADEIIASMGLAHAVK